MTCGKKGYIESVRQYRLHIANVVMIAYTQLIILCKTTLCKQVGIKRAGRHPCWTNIVCLDTEGHNI